MGARGERRRPDGLSRQCHAVLGIVTGVAAARRARTRRPVAGCRARGRWAVRDPAAVGHVGLGFEYAHGDFGRGRVGNRRDHGQADPKPRPDRTPVDDGMADVFRHPAVVGYGVDDHRTPGRLVVQIRHHAAGDVCRHDFILLGSVDLCLETRVGGDRKFEYTGHTRYRNPVVVPASRGTPRPGRIGGHGADSGLVIDPELPGLTTTARLGPGIRARIIDSQLACLTEERARVINYCLDS